MPGKWRGHVLNPCNWSYEESSFHLWPEEVSVRAEGRKQLCRSLRVPNVCELLLVCLLKDIRPKRWLVILGHMVERKIPISGPNVIIRFANIQILMISGVSVSPRISHPEIKARVDKHEPQRALLISDYSCPAVEETVLVQDNWLVDNLILLGNTGSFLPWDSKYGIDIAVLSIIVVLFQWIPQFSCDEGVRRRLFHRLLQIFKILFEVASDLQVMGNFDESSFSFQSTT